MIKFDESLLIKLSERSLNPSIKIQISNLFDLDFMNWLNLIQTIVSLLLICAILVQARGTGLSTVFGGESGIYRTKRGAERILFFITVFLAIAFLVIALANVLLRT